MLDKSHIREFIGALSDEIAELKRGGGGSSIKCYEGKFSSKSGNFFIYIFRIESQLIAMDDSPAKVQVKGETYPGQIVTVQGFEVTVGIEENLGDYIPEAKIITNLWYLLDLLKRRYEKYLNEEINLTTSLADKVFAFAESITGMKEIPDIPQSSKLAINEDQEKAIERSLGSEVSFIWGPPGTGKTTTIGVLAASMLSYGYRVLIVSHTNVAVDNAIWEAATILEETEDYRDGKILRFGTPTPDNIKEGKSLEERFEMVIPEKATEKISQAYLEELRKIERELTPLETRLTNLQVAIEKSKTFDQVKDKLIQLRKEGANIRAEIAKLEDESLKLSKLIAESELTLNEALQAGSLKRFFKRLKPDQIRAHISELESEKNATQKGKEAKIRQHGKIKRGFEDIQSTAKALREEIRTLENGLGISATQMVQEEELLKSKIEPLKQRGQEINQILQGIQERLLSEAKLIATTLTKACISKELDDEQFGTIIIDEASMAPLTHLYYAICRASEKACVIGDFRQLSPIAICEDSELVRKWLSRDIFEQTGITQAVDSDESHPRLGKLRDQFRMAEEIAEIPNKFFYGGDLRTKTVESQLPEPAIGDSRLLLFTTDSLNPWASRIEAGSRYNIYNGMLVNEIISEIRKKGGSSHIGIITPYRAQAKLINLILEDSGFKERVSTVHRFQGLEQDAIIFDTCEGPPLSVSGLLNERVDEDAKRLLNVALTRPKSQLIVIANANYLRKKLPLQSYLVRLVEHLRTNGEVVDSSCVLSGYICEDFERWKRIIEPPFFDEDLDEFGNLYTQNNFYPAFFADLRTAKEEIIIVSPFLAANRARRFFEIFQHKQSQGVNVRVFTEARGVQEKDQYRKAGEVFDELNRIGVTLREIRKCHQKLAIIDRRIAWEGSLNILSHSDLKEHMRRKGNHPKTCAELIKMHNLGIEEDSRHKTGQIKVLGLSCPECEGKIIVKRGRYGPFLACENYPCKFIYRVRKGDSIRTDQKCSQGHTMVIKRGPRGLFLGCEMYPNHSETRPL